MDKPPPRFRRGHSFFLLLLLGSVIGSGCNARFKTTYPVRGQVFYEGKPAKGAQVVFQPVDDPEGKAIRPQAKVQADGSFVLSTYQAEDGAPAGEYRVRIYKMLGHGPTNLLPERYRDPETSGFAIRVEKRDNVLEAIQLSR